MSDAHEFWSSVLCGHSQGVGSVDSEEHPPLNIIALHLFFIFFPHTSRISDDRVDSCVLPIQLALEALSNSLIIWFTCHPGSHFIVIVYFQEYFPGTI